MQKQLSCNCFLARLSAMIFSGYDVYAHPERELILSLFERMPVSVYLVFMHIPCIMYDGKGTAMRQTASTQKPSDKPQVIAVRFFALALILAHVISFATGSQFWGLCTYPVVWLMMIVFMMVRHWLRNSEGQHHSR